MGDDHILEDDESHDAGFTLAWDCHCPRFFRLRVGPRCLTCNIQRVTASLSI